MVAFEQRCCIRAMWLSLGKKWLYSGKMIILERGGRTLGRGGSGRAKMLYSGQKWL